MEQTRAVFDRTSQRLRRYIDQIEPPDSLVLVLTAMVVGIGTGLGAVIFVRLLAQVAAITSWLVTVGLSALRESIALVLVMALAGLIVGYMVNRWAREAKGHGVPEVMEAVALRGGRIRPRVAAIKVLASSITIGSGGSAGREGPIVQVGSALGSTIGQWLRFSDDRIRTLVACGGAAGIAATFNAPIAGAIFALEIILGRFTTRYFGAVVISSVAAGIVSRAFLSDQPAFAVPAYEMNGLAELPIYLVLGVLAALVAVLFIRVLYFFESWFEHLPIHPALVAALGMALTGALAGVVAFLFGEPMVLGPGLHFIGEAINDDFSMSLSMMAILLVSKMLATSFTLGAGNSGGVFAPSLFLGAVLGGMVGAVAQAIWPNVITHPGAFAIVGMAAVFAGAARAPITAVLIVFEMSNDYKLILPLMMATVISTLLAEHLFSESIYTLKLKLKGITLQSGRDQDLMQSLFVGEAMNRTPYVVEKSMPLAKLEQFFQETHSHSFPVVDEDHNLVGMVSITDLERYVEERKDNNLCVADIATMGEILFAYDDEPLSEALQRIAVRDVNKMPVVSRQEPTRVVGVIRRRDIIKAYNIALTRRARGQQREAQLSLRQIDETEFLEVKVAPGSLADGRSLASLANHLPHDCVIISVRRKQTVLIPHGDTILQSGDLVSAFLHQKDEAQLRDCLLGRPATANDP